MVFLGTSLVTQAQWAGLAPICREACYSLLPDSSASIWYSYIEGICICDVAVLIELSQFGTLSIILPFIWNRTSRRLYPISVFSCDLLRCFQSQRIGPFYWVHPSRFHLDSVSVFRWDLLRCFQSQRIGLSIGFTRVGSAWIRSPFSDGTYSDVFRVRE
jgi:hypothetical protein